MLPQVDWEAILTQHPDQFIESVGKWLYPVQAGGGTEASTTQGIPKQQVSLPGHSGLGKIYIMIKLITHVNS